MRDAPNEQHIFYSTFSEFFHENQEKFLSFTPILAIRDRQEAEDILMESMITLWENRDKWEEENSNFQEKY